MDFKDLLLKMAVNLSPEERAQLSRFASETQSTNAYVSGKRFENPVITNPDFRSSPLHTFIARVSNAVEIANNTSTAVTFDSGDGETGTFDFGSNNSKIKIDASQLNAHIDGLVRWESNATGYREVQLLIYDSTDTLLATQTLNRMMAVNGSTTVQPISYTDNIRVFLLSASYITFNVLQTSGAGLDLAGMTISIGVA